MTEETLKKILDDYGLGANKIFGQHFLLDEIVLQDMIDVAKVSKDDTVLEVGPGIGNLTKFLIEKAGVVVAIEKDDNFIPILNSLSKKHKNFSYHIQDILKTDLTGLTNLSEYKVVANIPYYITGKIIQKFLQAPVKPRSLTLLVQKEVAKNITAEVGQLNLLAISIQLYAKTHIVTTVPARSFYPAPKIDSAVVHIEILKDPQYKIENENDFFKILRACFMGKRKQIHNTLTNNLNLPKEQVVEILDTVAIPPQLRPQQLTIKQWIDLANAVNIILQ